MHWCSDIVRHTDSDVWTLLGAWIDLVTSTLEKNKRINASNLLKLMSFRPLNFISDSAPGYKYGPSSGHRVHSVWLSQTDCAWSLECYFERMKRGEKNGEVFNSGKTPNT